MAKFKNNMSLTSRHNVEHHYDISNDFYFLFLDPHKQYSCAYYKQTQDDLQTAQKQKLKRICQKLNLKAGQKVLDIGCGWGGLAIAMAQYANVEVVGITLSKQQYHYAQQRAKEAGVSDRVCFKLIDYRDVNEQFDRIISVGMFEHVGVRCYDNYFSLVKKLLKQDGIALIHSIGRQVPDVTNSWINTYIFPGGYIPALSEVIPSIEKQALYITDVEILRHHYAKTLRHWYERCQQVEKEVIDMFDKRFYRMWEYYLLSSEAGFLYQGLMVWQIQLCHHANALPITRDYMSLDSPLGSF